MIKTSDVNLRDHAHHAYRDHEHDYHVIHDPNVHHVHDLHVIHAPHHVLRPPHGTLHDMLYPDSYDRIQYGKDCTK